jgi:hypothetical protein
MWDGRMNVVYKGNLEFRTGSEVCESFLTRFLS